MSPRYVTRVAVIAMAILAGCTPPRQKLTESEEIVRDVLALQALDGGAICTDDVTHGDPLAVFREMTQAPRQSKAILGWHTPTPLHPLTQVRENRSWQPPLGGGDFAISEPEPRRDFLPGMDQMRLAWAARHLAKGVGVVREQVVLRPSWTPKHVVARWWPINRIRRDCWPLFLVSDIVRKNDTAFVTVQAEHWGTLYALKKNNGKWDLEAEWSRWLY